MLVIGSLTINFFQMQIDWIDEQKQFRWYKDLIPKSLVFSLLMYIAIGILLKIAFTGDFDVIRFIFGLYRKLSSR